jgi:ribosomal protein S18 acetylase RimI-like enzyme
LQPQPESLPAGIAAAADDAAVARTLSAAFQADPAISFIWPDPAERSRRLPGFFAMMIAADRAGHGRVIATADHEAATLWLPPGHGKLGVRAMLARLPALWRVFGSGIGRALALNTVLEAHFPATPHHYLHFAGCRPADQGKGHGGQAIRAGLSAADAQGLPTWLETATHGNVALYQAIGFRVICEYDIPRGPHFWGMQRS